MAVAQIMQTDAWDGRLLQCALALRPMQAVSGGQMVCLSTPFGKRGFFWSEWESESPRWQRIRVTAEECPRIDGAFLEAERMSQAAWYFAQEYLCEFRETSEQIFSEETIAAMFANALLIEPLSLGR